MERAKGLMGKVQEFVNPTPIEDKYKKLLQRVHEEILKPLGFKKEGQNFRQFTPDGLGKIINFWRYGKCGIRDRRLCFAIDTGIYLEAGPSISNRKFTKYDCQIRNVANNPKPVTVFAYPEPQFWYIFKRTDMDSMFEGVKQALQESLDLFAQFESRQSTIDMILDGTAQQYSLLNVSYHLIEEMLDDELKEQLRLKEEEAQ